MMQKKPAIANLVFEGGGAKGAAYAGCMEVFDSAGLLAPVRRIAGTSAGAITASLLACGAGSEGLTECVQHTDFRRFIADWGGLFGDAARIAGHYGMHSGDGFVSLLQDRFQRYAGKGDLSFGELAELAAAKPARFKSLSVVASNLTRQRPQVFDAHCSPDLPVCQAVRASISIPLIFEPVTINGDYFVDGGLAVNFPIGLYDEVQRDPDQGSVTTIRNPSTLGFYLEPRALMKDGDRYNPDSVRIDTLKSFAVALGSYLTENANAKYIHPKDRLRTVFIDDLGVSATDFSAPQATIEALMESGRAATHAWLSRQAAGSPAGQPLQRSA